MDNLIKYYDTYKDPAYLRKGFGSEFEFVVWLRINDLKTLRYILKCFENEQLYENCISINRVIKEKEKYHTK